MPQRPHKKNRIDSGSFAALVAASGDYFRFLEQMGCKGFDCSKDILDILESWEQGVKGSAETIEAVCADLGDCQRCRLAEGRKNIVFGSGDSHARLVFVGEGPGYEEDRQGQPFVGAAGQLLTKIIEAIEFTRSQVYICNIVKCRPPGNRNPKPDEIAACLPFLKRQIAAINPDFICTLGGVAAQTLLDTKLPISKLRGVLYDYMGIKVMPTYHPAFLLRSPEKKRSVWEDMKILMKAMDG
jgi:uracil-DNA glycosylase